ncbi:MAG TPA: DEAD/DEAH box helicase, partial [Ktedonobacteraceae bacterium]|nr:DEAD/DEAH box helicase [Ktedonobacteraceae bacterium]
MFAEVLTSAARWQTEQPLLTYIVPVTLEQEARPGQLVAVPYGERLVEGIIWRLTGHLEDTDLPQPADNPRERTSQALTLDQLRPISAILDPEPALLPHQRALAEWMATYYVTPLAQVAQSMLPPGLAQRSKVVLRLISDDPQPEVEQPGQPSITSTRALIGLLLADGDLDIARLKEMLGPKRAGEVIKEALASGLIAREAQLDQPRARARRKRLVRLRARGEELEAWKERARTRIQESLPDPTTMPLAPDNVRRRPTKHAPDPWAIPGASSVFTLTRENRVGLLAQRQLAAIDLLEHDRADASAEAHWTPTMLCKASSLHARQLTALAQEGIVTIEELEVQRDPLSGRNIPPSAPLPLTAEQRDALSAIVGDTPILLHGVTGSGKTEVYLQALAAIIARGQRGIVLVPEIALTAQAIYRFAGRFPGRVAVIHSALSDGERYDEWRRIRAGKVDVVVGSRSALFSPVPDLGLLILDEEHEPAYKQSERKPTYLARDTAIALAKLLHIPVVL